MTAKEAAAVSNSVAARRRQELEAAAEKEKIEREKAELYIRTGAVDYAVQTFYEKVLPDAVSGGRRSCVLITGHPVTCELVKERILNAGFKVSPTEDIHHDSYGGSSDDGHAYAHDAYSEWVFTVSW